MEGRGDKTIQPHDHFSNNSSNCYSNTVDYEDLHNNPSNPIDFNSRELISREDIEGQELDNPNQENEELAERGEGGEVNQMEGMVVIDDGDHDDTEEEFYS